MISEDGEWICCDGPPPVDTEGSCVQRTKSHSQKGWFFTKDDKAYCPDHIPDWVEAWRERKKERR